MNSHLETSGTKEPSDILFIVPPFKYGTMDAASAMCPHLGVASLASFLIQAGYKVKILDAYALKLSHKQVENYLRRNPSKVVGVGAVTAEFTSAIELLKSIKRIQPNTVTFFGGPHPTIMPETANIPEADYIILGEAEHTVLELMNYVIKKIGSPAKIKGIMFRNKGVLQFTGARPLIHNLDELPFPAYHLLPMNEYRPYAIYDVGRKFCTAITSRGCPFSCTYCTSSSVFGHRFRAMSPERTFEMIKMLYTKYGIRHIYFQDDEFTINNERVSKLCDLLIKSKIDLVWECLARVSDVNENLLKKMYKAGCRGIVYGAECGYDEGLVKINKKITTAQIRSAIELSKKAKLHTRASFIMGFPWETEKEVKQTINFATSLKTDITYFQILTPYPGTPIYNEIKQKGLIVKNDWDKYVQHAIVGTEPVIKTEHLSNEQLQYWNAIAFRRFYFRPTYMARQLLSMRKISQLKRYSTVGLLLSLNIIRRATKLHHTSTQEHHPQI